jgi:putative NADH-flavin reductase
MIMDLAVFGANGPTGRQVVGQALTAGHHVTAVTRTPDEYPLTSPHLYVVAADVTDPDAVGRVLSGPQAVISTFGVPYSRDEITVYSQGIANITRAMTIHSIERLVCVSSTTVATEEAPDESLFWRKVVIPVLRNIVGRTLYDDMQRMEEIVQSSSLDWTVVRPAGLFDAAEPTDDYEVAPRRLPGRYTSRADLAETLIREATAPQHPRSIIEVITRSGLPLPMTTFLKEAFGIGGRAP